MARNRKHQSAAVRFGPAVKAFLLCAVIGGSGVGYVWQKSNLDELGREIKQRESRQAELKYQNQKLREQLAMLRQPAQLDKRVRDLKLGMALPQPAQIWRLPEPLPTSTAEAVGRLIAQHPGEAPPP